MTMKWNWVVGFICALITTQTLADLLSIPLFLTSEKGMGKSVGSVTITETSYGLLFTPHVQGLSPGLHGFHVHQNPACDNNGMAAGGHLDPQNTSKHLGPYNNQGHLGDLPVMYVTSDGTSTTPLLAPRLKHLSDINQHSLMIHEGGDNYSDTPTKLGGGGTRMACGIIHG